MHHFSPAGNQRGGQTRQQDNSESNLKPLEARLAAIRANIKRLETTLTDIAKKKKSQAKPESGLLKIDWCRRQSRRMP